MELKKFKRGPKRVSGIPAIGISKKKFSLNILCIKKHFLNRNHAELFFDEKEKVIGILVTDKETENSFKVSLRRPESPTGAIWCGEFIRKNNIMDIIEKIGKRSFLVKEGEKGILLIKLK